MNRVIRYTALREPAITSAILRTTPRTTPLYATRSQFVRHASFTPTILQVSFWKSLIPTPLRRKQPGDWRSKKPKSKEWNPATFFIIAFLFIGSTPIQMIALKQEFNSFMRRAEVRIGLLQEVVERLQKGEDVDVEKILGTGDEAKEKGWEEVIRDIERGGKSKTPPKNAEKAKQSSPDPMVPDTKAEPNVTKTEPKGKTSSYADFF
ncbi:hypothetical protein SLS62_006406 [Diatrype stigma]|uniref:Uncharacterized protein n=1 Tax=Diatrype stigma TaxID=117547 RepID=A0AAN9YP22_9PEZI